MKPNKDKLMQRQKVDFPKRTKVRALQVEIQEDLFSSIDSVCDKLKITKKEFVVYGLSLALVEAKKKI